MKAIILTSVFAALVFTTNINAKDITVYSNNESNGSGAKKEYVSIDNKTSKPVNKSQYEYAADGKVIERTVSKWEDGKGWTLNGKYEYKYEKTGKIASVTFTKWDNKTNAWSNTSDIIIHTYNDNNEFLSMKQIQVDNTTVNYDFISLK